MVLPRLTRVAPIALLACAAAGFAETAPSVPPVAPTPVHPAPVNPPPGPAAYGMPPAMGHATYLTEIHLVTLDAAGTLDPASQKLVDTMRQDNWFIQSMSTVSAGNPVTLALLFNKTVMPQQRLPAMPPPPRGAARPIS